MTFLLLNLLQSERRISAVVVIGAVLVFIAGVSLLVYFYRRYKRIEKEAEDDWDSSRHSLFVNVQPPAAEIEKAAGPASKEVETPGSGAVPVQAGGTREFAADLAVPSFAPATPAQPEPQLETPAVEEPIRTPAAPPEPRPTEILASPSLVEPVPKPESEHPPAPFEEGVWGSVKVTKQPPLETEPQLTSTSTAEPLSVARVEPPSHREQFEPPRIELISHREPYEPPTIEPLAPREAAATRELRSAQAPLIDQPFHPEERVAGGTVRFGSASEPIPRPLGPPPAAGETRELAGEVVVATSRMMPERSIPASTAPRIQRAGSILGLPAEASHQPLILGEAVRPSEDVGIGGLTNYGRDIGPKGGRAGTIALLVVVLLVGGAVGLYLLVPSVHSRVGALVAHLRGTDTQAALEAAMKRRAQVIPSTRPEVNKNMVTARGAVDNISDEPLENLSVEVSLQRGGGEPPEIRTVPVTPNPLPARERGTFEFEYDGKRDTGFLGYTITRLFSNGTEVRFRAPGQK